MKPISAIFLFLTLILSTLFSCANNVDSVVYSNIENGTLILNKESLINSRINLTGKWEFYWNCFVQPKSESHHNEITHIQCIDSDIDVIDNKYILFPSLWSGNNYNGTIISNEGYGSLRLNIKSPVTQTVSFRIGDMYSAYRMYLNGKMLASNGVPGKGAASEQALWLPQFASGKLLKGSNELLIHLSNHSHRKIGTWSYLEIGTAKNITGEKIIRHGIEMFLMGALLVISFYHLGLFFLRSDDRASLYFGILTLLTTIRVAVTGERILVEYLLQPFFETQVKIEYLSFYLGAPAFFSYIYRLFPTIRNKYVEQTAWTFAGLFSLFILFTDAAVYSYSALPYELGVLIIGFLVLSQMIYGLKFHIHGMLVAILGFIPLLLTAINDILYNNEISILPGYISYPVGIFIFFFAHAYLLADKSARTFNTINDLSYELEVTNIALKRFVPMEFLNILKKRSITEIQPGDQIHKELTIMYLDIKDFTSLSEKLKPEETFDFINTFLSRMNPIIHENNGFIDKYLGDGLMALFPGNPDNAIQAALKMQKTIIQYNEERATKSRVAIHAGIGIHTGMTVLGIIGTDARMDSTVISDAVNIGSRVQGLSRYFNSPVLLSIESLISLTNPSLYSFRIVGRVKVKGKSNSIVVAEVLDAIPDSTLFKETVTIFETALSEYQLGKTLDAKAHFEKVLSQNPNDKAARIYLEMIDQSISMNTSPELDLDFR